MTAAGVFRRRSEPAVGRACSGSTAPGVGERAQDRRTISHAGVLVGTTERARAWLGGPNQALGANPVELLRTPDAERVYRYLDAVMKNELRLPPRWRRDH
ncbi:MAG: DUF2384 domain-containing protein [Lysobacterales bacterium]|nr:MAG: DUF2384 domain-containing protein [Xanthomonadales bacterium]